MKQPEIEQEIIDMLGMAFLIDAAHATESTLDDLGLTSLEVVSAQLLFEDRWGEDLLFDYRPTGATTIREIAAEIRARQRRNLH